MRVRTIVSEDYTNYKLPSMFIGCISCDGKCCIEGGIPRSTCINNNWRDSNIIDVDDDELIRSYMSNPITSAIVFGLLEPMLQPYEIERFIQKLREEYMCNDPVIIYTGYTENEVGIIIRDWARFGNIIAKYGRFVPNQDKHFDDVLGVDLASPNQYAKHYA